MELLLRTKKLFVFLLIGSFFTIVNAEVVTIISNTNYTISQGSVFPNSTKRYLYNYDRLRLQADYHDSNFFGTLIGDGVNYFGHEYISSTSFSYTKFLESDTPYSTQTPYENYYEGEIYSKLYRLYGGYEDEANRIVVGLQNITMGVGRIWSPTNLFNPRNTYALEPDETFGVSAVSYTRHIDDMSDITIVASQKKDFTYKYALRYKAFLEYADVALNVVASDETKMIGYEVEANLADSGIEVRSEGAYIKNSLNVTLTTREDIEFFQGIIGADYGFENGVTLVTEALYSTQRFSYNQIFLNVNSEILPNLLYSSFYFGTTLSYSMTLYLDASLGYIESFNTKNSRYLTPTLTYTLNDFNSFSLGAMIQNGTKDSEFGMFSNTYYFNYSLAF
jgi:hypothetical protein